MSAIEFTEWRELYKIEPFGELRNDFRLSLIASTFYNMIFVGLKLQGQGDKKPADFMHDYWKAAPKLKYQNLSTMKAILKALADSY